MNQRTVSCYLQSKRELNEKRKLKKKGFFSKRKVKYLRECSVEIDTFNEKKPCRPGKPDCKKPYYDKGLIPNTNERCDCSPCGDDYEKQDITSSYLPETK